MPSSCAVPSRSERAQKTDSARLGMYVRNVANPIPPALWPGYIHRKRSWRVPVHTLGQAMLEALLENKQIPSEIAELSHWSLAPKIPQIIEALEVHRMSDH